ncbi:MAG TPA: chemotaxis protein CheB [Gemmatimonadaceae bacterium]|nr:chemotaxis protein CheB [Gemmatimonadaceae bacterium]
MRRSLQSPDEADGVVAIAASLGGLPVLELVLSALPVEFPLPVVVVQHLSDQLPSYFADLLAARVSVPTRWVEHHGQLSPGVVHIAPPGRHVLINESRRTELSEAPRVNHCRPSADPLFASAAANYGAGAIAVVLTGRLCDGAAGARAVHQAKGVVIAQDPATCVAPGMPRAAIEAGAARFVLPPNAISRALIALTMVPGARAMFGCPRAA